MFWGPYVICFALGHTDARTSGFAIGPYVIVPSFKKITYGPQNMKYYYNIVEVNAQINKHILTDYPTSL